MDHDQNVSDMANEVLARQAKVRVERTGEPLEEARAAVLKTEAGRQLRTLREGPYRDERAGEWQEGMAQERAEERAAEPDKRSAVEPDKRSVAEPSSLLGSRLCRRSCAGWSSARTAS